jgi:molybdate transport system substrate-binding protein
MIALGRVTALALALSGVVIGNGLSSAASAADIKLLSPGSLTSVMKELLAQFEQSSGHKVVVDYININLANARIRKGEVADVAIVSPEQAGDLVKAKFAVAGTPSNIAKVGIGLVVRKGAARPDIGTVDAFKSAMLASKSVTFNNPKSGGPVGIYMMALFDQLGIAEPMKPKIKFAVTGVEGTVEIVGNGEIQYGFSQVSEMINRPTIDLVAPLPEKIQHYTRFTAAILATSREPAAAKALLTYLSTKETGAVFKSRGLEPG